MRSARRRLLRLCEVEEYDVRWIADGGIMASKRQFPFPPIHVENSDVVCSLIADVEELTGRIEIEAARIISARPFLADEGQLTRLPNREYSNAVVQTVAGINKSAIGGNQDLGAKVTAGESGRQTRDRLARSEAAVHGVVVEEDNGGAFLLEGVTPAIGRVKCEMSRPITGRERNG